jgi:hypothetical protein
VSCFVFGIFPVTGIYATSGVCAALAREEANIKQDSTKNVVLSRLRVRMITPGTSEQQVPGSVVPGVPGGTLGHTPKSASQAGITRPKKQGPDAPNLGPYAPQRWLQ